MHLSVLRLTEGLSGFNTLLSFPSWLFIYHLVTYLPFKDLILITLLQVCLEDLLYKEAMSKTQKLG